MNQNQPVALQAANEVTSAGYRVGYCRPPLEHRFKKGRSGNPKGRPKARTDVGALLSETLDERIVVKTGGSEKKVSKQEAFITSLVNGVIQGKPKAIRSFVKLLRRARQLTAPPTIKKTGVLVVGHDAD